MRSSVLIASLASLASVHAAALANPEPQLPVPVTVPSIPSLTGVTSFVPKDITNLVPLPGLPTTPNAAAILAPLGQATALAGSLAALTGPLGLSGLDVGSLPGQAFFLLGFATQITGTLAPLTGLTGVIPIAGNLPAGSITGADASKIVQAIKELFAQHSKVLSVLESKASIIRSVPGVGGLIYTALLTLKGALLSLVAVISTVLDQAGTDGLTNLAGGFFPSLDRVINLYSLLPTLPIAI